MTIQTTEVKKSSTYKDCKQIIDICGYVAKQDGIEFNEFINVCRWLLYNTSETSENIGCALYDIINEIQDSNQNWFYETWLFIEKEGKNSFEIIKEVQKTRSEPCAISIEDCLEHMSYPDSSEILQLIFNYFEEGEPQVL